MRNLWWVAQTGSVEEFLELYRPEMATSWDRTFGALLDCVLARVDAASRVQLGARLLNDGADASALADDGGTTAHTLLSHHDHDPVVEAPLLERLFDGGADVNKVVRVKALGTPLNALKKQYKFSDEFFAPFYDVFFSRGDLDLQGEMMNGHSGMNILRKSAELRPELLRRAEEYLRARGVDPDEVK